jgi:hypothetical protein
VAESGGAESIIVLIPLFVSAKCYSVGTK